MRVKYVDEGNLNELVDKNEFVQPTFTLMVETISGNWFSNACSNTQSRLYVTLCAYRYEIVSFI